MGREIMAPVWRKEEGGERKATPVGKEGGVCVWGGGGG